MSEFNEQIEMSGKAEEETRPIHRLSGNVTLRLLCLTAHILFPEISRWYAVSLLLRLNL